MRHHPRLAAVKAVAMHLALAGMLVRALLPAGWMPSASPGAGSPLVICTGTGLVQITLDSKGHAVQGKPAKDDGQTHQVCPFAAAAHLAPAAAHAAVHFTPILLGHAEAFEQSRAHHGGAFRAYASRAPPIREA